MTDIHTDEFEDDFLKEVVTAMAYAAIKTHPDAYPSVLRVLNEVLLAGIDADTIGGSEPAILRSIAHAIREVLKREDPPSTKFITAV